MLSVARTDSVQACRDEFAAPSCTGCVCVYVCVCVCLCLCVCVFACARVCCLWRVFVLLFLKLIWFYQYLFHFLMFSKLLVIIELVDRYFTFLFRWNIYFFCGTQLFGCS